VGELAKDSLSDAAKFTMEVTAYQNDFFETLTLITDIFNINQCLELMPAVRFRMPGLWWYLEQVRMGTAWMMAIGQGANKDDAVVAAQQAKQEFQQRTVASNPLPSLMPESSAAIARMVTVRLRRVHHRHARRRAAHSRIRRAS